VRGSFESLRDREQRYVMQTFKRLPVEFVSGDRWNVYDSDGHEYLDFVAGIAVNVLGHAHPAVVEALHRQSQALIHTSNLYYTAPQVDLAARLNELGFSSRVFFTNSGTEAVEAALKVARKFGKLHRGGAFEVITANGSFHGRTLGALAATAQPKYQEPMLPMPEGFRYVDFNDIEALRRAITQNTAAVMLELVQGESGAVPADTDYVRGARELCDAEGILLIFDEVQTGIGRSGHFYAFQHYGVTPDVVTLAKGLGGGVPVGACLASERADVFAPGDHGSTFGGNPLACATALAVLDTLEREDVLANVRRVGQYLGDRLRLLADDFDAVAGERGLGLLRALVLREDIGQALQLEALANGLIVNAIGERVVRLAPPLIVGEAQVDQAVDMLAQSLDTVITRAGAASGTA